MSERTFPQQTVDGEITVLLPDEGLVFQCVVVGKLSPQ